MSILRLSGRWASIVALASVCASTNLRADVVILNVNTLLSNVTLAGQVGGSDGPPATNGVLYAGQTPTSLSTSLAGTIKADLTAGVFTFAPGSAVSFNNSGTYNNPFPNINNPPLTELGNYAVTATGPVPLAGGAVLTILGVYRNLVLDINSGTAQNGGVLTAATMNFTSGLLDFSITPAAAAPGTASLAGSNGLNTSTSLVAWDGTTLRIPVTFTTTGGTGRVENWTGTIVAAVPEPSSIALMSLVGFVGLSYATVRGRRAKRLVK